MQGFAKFFRVLSAWHWLGLIGLTGLSFGLHFWGLERFNTLVFDEVYYAKYANSYLTHTPFFDAHPPLGKYLIALGMWLSDFHPVSSGAVNGLTGAMRSPWSYRWLNALTGSLLPLLVAGMTYQLSQRWSYALLAGLLTAVDGLLLVESRYALINIHLVFLGLAGHWFCLLALRHHQPWQRWGWLAIAGTCFGAAIAVKWSGLGFLLGILLNWGAAYLDRWWRARGEVLPAEQAAISAAQQPLLQRFTQLHWLPLLLNLCLLPTLVYGLLWIPHLQINQVGFLEVHRQMLGYHTQMGDGPQVHPYCSRWYTWPLILRPMSYFYELTQSKTELPPLSPPLPPGTGQVVYDVHAMGNPLLWWFSTLALLILVEMLIEQLPAWLQRREPRQSSWISDSGVSFYLVVNYGINFLPWSLVSRCTFIYLYMAAATFGFLAVAYVLDRWLTAPQKLFRVAGITILGLILLAFVYWLPIYLGLPLAPDEFQQRMWFRSWI